MDIVRNPTRSVRIGSIQIGAAHPIAVQSMTATHTTDIDATVQLVNLLQAAGADVVRIAVDSKKDAEALAEIRRQTTANLSVDLQENYRLAENVCRTSTRSATTPDTCTIMNAKSRGRKKSLTWPAWRPTTTVRCESA